MALVLFEHFGKNPFIWTRLRSSWFNPAVHVLAPNVALLGFSFLFLISIMSLAAHAADSDGDGVQDSVDDCPWSAGTSTVDKDGCPDRDGDGTSDFNDVWAIGNPNYQNEFTTSSNSDYYGVDYSPDGEFIVWVLKTTLFVSGTPAHGPTFALLTQERT